MTAIFVAKDVRAWISYTPEIATALIIRLIRIIEGMIRFYGRDVVDRMGTRVLLVKRRSRNAQ